MTRISVALQGLALFVCLPLSAQKISSVAGWPQSGVCYEVFVRSFYDSDDDGVGDLRGLIQKLDYINDGSSSTQKDLGASCIWLMPVAQSPSYHGYDVTNYYEVNRDYGTNEDFKQLVAEAHRRGIRVLVDLVLNHSSSEHPYFKSALVDAASPYRDWYLWSPTQRKLSTWEAPVWHRAGSREEYYFGLFWSGMPDLNLKHPAVRAEAEKVARFWLTEMKVDGFRLDAVQHFFEAGDTVRHARPIHSWLHEYEAALRRIKPDVFTIGEVWDSTGAVAAYYPDQLDAYFIFDVADALVDAVRSGSGQRLVSAVQRAQRDLPPGRWSPFLRNHDQTRTMTELRGDLARHKLASTLLLTMPGLPFVYYGEEIGMTGSKQAGDPRLRTPMQWSRAGAAGFTRGTPWEPLQPDSFTANVETQENDAGSLLNLHRRLIHLRSANPALAGGDFVALNSSPGTLAYLRRVEGRFALVVANLSGQPAPRVQLSSTDAVLPAGRYLVRELLGNQQESSVRVKSDGRIRGWVPVPALGPLESRIFELSRRD